MDKTNLSNIANIIAKRRCVLFAGAGLTKDSGGILWKELVEYLKEKFRYSSPLKDKIQIVSDIIRINGREKVYNTIKDRLKDVTLKEPIIKLASFPWFTIFTTNYDLALEKALEEYQSLSIQTIVTGHEFVLTGLPNEILCVKLMGSLDIPYDEPGSMVLDSGDFAIAREQRGRIFDLLACHAANLSFLFVGYSFDDGVFLEILDRLKEVVGAPKNTYYALFRSEPDEERTYLLKQQYGVEIIVGDLKDFTQKLSEEISILDPSDLTIKKLRIGSDIIPIDLNKISSFLSQYYPILSENYETATTPNKFLKGYTESLKPFEFEWHFEREEINKIINNILNFKEKGKSNIIVIEGNPGTGRTFVIKASIDKLIREHRTLAFEITNYSVNKIPSKEEFEEFIKEIENKIKERKIKPIERVVFFAEFPLEYNTIFKFKKLCVECKYTMNLIFEDIKISQIKEYFSEDKYVTYIDVGDKIDKDERERLAKYVVESAKKHKFPEITIDKALELIKEEKHFFSIIYRSLDPSRRSINKIIGEEFTKITNKNVRMCISFCALSTFFEIDLPLTILRKTLSDFNGCFISYPDLYDILEKTYAFVKEKIDNQNNPYISIYHPIIAKQLTNIVGSEFNNKLLFHIGKTADLRSKIEADFIGNLFITNGVNLNGYKPFTDEGLKDALIEIKKRQMARPIVHHLARFLAKKNIHDENIIPLLEEALIEPRERYALVERKENVLTTLAKAKWDQNKDTLVLKDRNDPAIQEIIDLLHSAREIHNPSIHSYDVHTRILKDLWEKKQKEEKIKIIAEAIEIINEGLEISSEDEEGKFSLKQLLIQALTEIDYKEAQRTADNLLVKEKDGTGYYSLALVEYYKNMNQTKAKSFLNKALKADIYPPKTIILMMEILLKEKSPSYFKLLELANIISSKFDFKDNWKSAFYKAVIYVINGYYEKAAELFKFSNRKSPKILQRQVELFWMEGGRRKKHRGKIDRIFTEREGRIYAHNIEGWKDKIFFDPRNQEKKRFLKPGLLVDFELGFSPKGPIAFDIRPHET
ncbi:MAG: SIR2 family protein [Candidatus Heimdallarchaeaceae archaeon]